MRKGSLGFSTPRDESIRERFTAIDMSEKPSNFNNYDKLDWIEVRDDVSLNLPYETVWQRTVRKSKENPFVPIGCTATVAALVYGIYSFSQGRSLMSNYMMRARVAAQGFTIIAIVAGLIVQGNKR